MSQSLGSRIRELRKIRGLTQRQLAERVEGGLDFTFLSKIENDKEQASERTIRALAAALQADADELLLLAQRISTEQRKAMTATEAGRMFLRSARDLSEADWKKVLEMVEKLRKQK